VAQVRARCGLPPAAQAEPVLWMDGHQLLASVDIALDHCLPHEPPSLQILRHFPLTAHGTLGVMAITAATVGEALEAALQYHALVMPLFDFQRLPESPDGVQVRVQPTLDLGRHNAVLAELVIGVLRNVAPYTQVHAPVLLAEFAHAPSGPLEAYQAFFGATPRFHAAWHGFTVPRALLHAPLISGNQATHALLEQLLLKDMPHLEQGKPLTQRVRQRLQEGLRRGQLPTAEALAHELAMSARTLARRLQDEGQGLSRLLEQVRMARAEQLLQEGRLSLPEVATQSGFADASSFSRAFKRATGLTPAEHRERLRPAQSPR
jgi:AraC-like DNA-binding protein